MLIHNDNHGIETGLLRGCGSVLIETISIIDRLISWLNGWVSFILKEGTRLLVIQIKVIICCIGQMSLMDSCSEKERSRSGTLLLKCGYLYHITYKTCASVMLCFVYRPIYLSESMEFRATGDCRVLLCALNYTLLKCVRVYVILCFILNNICTFVCHIKH